MKLSLFSITIVLASFVAANPILAPRAASRPFKLGTPDRRSQDPFLQAEYVPQRGHRGYYRLGWFGPTWKSPEQALFFPDGPPPRGRVFDIRQNGYEIVLERLYDPAPNDNEPAYRVLLVHQSDIARRDLKTNIVFDLSGDQFGCLDTALQTRGHWWACPYYEPGGSELYHVLQYSQSKPKLCPAVREVTLIATYQSPEPVQVTANLST